VASIDVRIMVVPWIKITTGYDLGVLYSYFKIGKRRYE